MCLNSGDRDLGLREKFGSNQRLFQRERNPDFLDSACQIAQNFVLGLGEVGEAIDYQCLDPRKGTTYSFAECGAGQPESTFMVKPILLGKVLLITGIDQANFEIPSCESGSSLLTDLDKGFWPDLFPFQFADKTGNHIKKTSRSRNRLEVAQLSLFLQCSRNATQQQSFHHGRNQGCRATHCIEDFLSKQIKGQDTGRKAASRRSGSDLLANRTLNSPVRSQP